MRKWEGLSVFDSEADVRGMGLARNWRMGAYIVTLDIPDEAPITHQEPEHAGSGHWLLYDADGRMLDEESAAVLLTFVTRVVHGLEGSE